MSGTPTPSTPTSHVAHLHPLLAFLRQQPYGSHRKTWEVANPLPLFHHLTVRDMGSLRFGTMTAASQVDNRQVACLLQMPRDGG